MHVSELFMLYIVEQAELLFFDWDWSRRSFEKLHTDHMYVRLTCLRVSRSHWCSAV